MSKTAEEFGVTAEEFGVTAEEIGVTAEEIGRGADGIIYSEYNEKYGQVAIKRYINKPKDNFYLNRLRRIRNEALILMEVKKLIERKICPNFAYIYKTKIKYLPDNMDNKGDKDISYIMQCKYDITFQDFLKTWHPVYLYKSIIFQIIAGILALQKHLSGTHGDLLGNNIFIKYINKDITFSYQINNQTYYIKTYGYLVVLGDFGLAKIRQPITKSDFTYLANLPGIISYYSDSKPVDIIKDDGLEMLIKKLRRYDKDRPINRQVYLYLYQTGKHVPKLSDKLTTLINKLTKLINDGIGIKVDTIQADTLNLSEYRRKNARITASYHWKIT
jgi:hypothetical protein